MAKAIYEIGKFVFSGIVVGFIVKFKEISGIDLLLIATGGAFLTVILFTIAYLVDRED